MSQVTKRALEESLKHLLIQKPLNKITISDITEDCGVNRMTFYYHFQDIYDLVEWSCEEDARRALAGKKTYQTWQEGFLNIFHFVEAEKPFVLNVYRSVSRDKLERYLYEATYQLLMGVVEEKSAGLKIQQSDKEFIAGFYKYGFVGIMLEWIDHDMKEAPEAIVERLGRTIHGDIAGALERFCQDAPPKSE